MDNINITKIEELLELKKLFEAGILTKEELDVEKKKILGEMASNDNSPSVQPQKETSSPEMNQEIAAEMDGVDYSMSEESVPSKNKYYIIGAIAVILIVAAFILFPIFKKRDTNTEIGSESEIVLSKIAKAYNDYEGYNVILSERKLTGEDLEGKDKEELALLRNMIYARHGYRFKKDDLFRYFSKYSWYAPTTSEESNVYGRMSEIEKYNIDFIKQYEDTISVLSIKELLKIVSALDIEEGFVTGINNLSDILSVAKKHKYRIVDNAWMHSMGGYLILYKGCSLDHAGEFVFVKDIIEDYGSFVMIATKDWNANYPIATILLFRQLDLDFLISEAQSVGFERVADKDGLYVYDNYELTIGQEGDSLCPNHVCYSISIGIVAC